MLGRGFVESPSSKLRGGVGVAEVETVEPRFEFLFALGNGVELVLHVGGELIVHQVPEVTLEQIHNGERAKRRHERFALLPDVAASINGLHHRRVGRGTTNAEIFELLDERGLGEAVRRLGLVTFGAGNDDVDDLALVQWRQKSFLIRQLGLGIVSALHVGAPKPGELNA